MRVFDRVSTSRCCGSMALRLPQLSSVSLLRAVALRSQAKQSTEATSKWLTRRFSESDCVTMVGVVARGVARELRLKSQTVFGEQKVGSNRSRCRRSEADWLAGGDWGSAGAGQCLGGLVPLLCAPKRRLPMMKLCSRVMSARRESSNYRRAAVQLPYLR